MQIKTKHLKAVRKAYGESQLPCLESLYEEMANSIKPKITVAMLDATERVVSGKTVEEAAEELGVSKVAVSQAAVKGLNRLAGFYQDLGAKLPDELKEPFSLPKAKSHLPLLQKALNYYRSPKQSITWRI